MQRFAFDKNRLLIPAMHAEKQQNYYCRECGAPVRLRRGLHRTTHFFHLKNTVCRQGQKSQTHLRIQEYLQKIFGKAESVLEKQFPQIGRIADLVWEKEKLIFEIQCSGITPEEIASRNADYASLGYQVVWILHDRLYNRWKMTPAEVYLRDFPHYFSNMDPSGKGGVYDQLDWVAGHKRKIIKKIYEVNWKVPQRNFFSNSLRPQVPELLEKRFFKWPLHFCGDLIDKWDQGDEVFFSEIPTKNLDLPLSFRKRLRILYEKVRHFYLIIFQMILEKASK